MGKYVKDLEAKLKATSGFGILDEIKEQKTMIKLCFKMLYDWNNTLLRALLIPEPMLRNPLPQQCNSRGPTNAAIIVRYAWVFFDKLPGAKDFISNFLNPAYPGLSGYPGYDTEEKSEFPPFTGSRYDRFFSGTFGDDIVKTSEESERYQCDDENDIEEGYVEEEKTTEFDYEKINNECAQ